MAQVSVVFDAGYDEELRAVSLASVESQTLTDWEVVTDLARATGEYVAFLDAGDSWVPDRLERLVALRKPLVADELEGERGNGDRVVFRTPAPGRGAGAARGPARGAARAGPGRPHPAGGLAARPPDAPRHRGRAGAEHRRTPPLPGPPTRAPAPARRLAPRRAQPAPRRLGRARGQDADDRAHVGDRADVRRQRAHHGVRRVAARGRRRRSRSSSGTTAPRPRSPGRSTDWPAKWMTSGCRCTTVPRTTASRSATTSPSPTRPATSSCSSTTTPPSRRGGWPRSAMR